MLLPNLYHVLQLAARLSTPPPGSLLRFLDQKLFSDPLRMSTSPDPTSSSSPASRSCPIDTSSSSTLQPPRPAPAASSSQFPSPSTSPDDLPRTTSLPSNSRSASSSPSNSDGNASSDSQELSLPVVQDAAGGPSSIRLPANNSTSFQGPFPSRLHQPYYPFAESSLFSVSVRCAIT